MLLKNNFPSFVHLLFLFPFWSGEPPGKKIISHEIEVVIYLLWTVTIYTEGLYPEMETGSDIGAKIRL